MVKHPGHASGSSYPWRLLIVITAVSCGGDGDPPTQPAPDTTPPTVEIAYPVDSLDEFLLPATDYDQTGNGLLDVRATWSDAGSGIDPTTARIEILGTIAGSVGSGDDLTGLWTQVALADSGIAYEETIAELVRQGTPRLVVSVADSAGNRGADTLEMHIRYGDHHRSFGLPYEPGAPTGDIVVCEDDGLLYLVRYFAIMVFDAITLDPLGTFPNVLAEPPARMLCIPGDPILYSTVRVERFDRTTLTWDTSIPGTFITDGIIQSRLDPDILWGGELGPGVPVQIDRSIPARVGGVGLPASSVNNEFTFALAVLDGDRKIYYSRAFEQGLVVGDPSTGMQLAHIDLTPFGGGLGITDNIVVSNDDRFVYAAVQGAEPGLAEVDTETDEVTRQVISINGVGIEVVINPAGDRLWLTTHDNDPAAPTPSLLIDPARMEILQHFPRPVAPGVETRWVLAATFHPSGKLLYQARDDDIDVYLIR